MGTGGSKQFNKARADERVTKLFNEVAGAADDAYKGEKKHITAADLMVRMEKYGKDIDANWTRKEIEKTIKKYDENKSGGLDKEEFKRALADMVDREKRKGGPKPKPGAPVKRQWTWRKKKPVEPAQTYAPAPAAEAIEEESSVHRATQSEVERYMAKREAIKTQAEQEAEKKAAEEKAAAEAKAAEEAAAKEASRAKGLAQVEKVQAEMEAKKKADEEKAAAEKAAAEKAAAEKEAARDRKADEWIAAEKERRRPEEEAAAKAKAEEEAAAKAAEAAKLAAHKEEAAAERAKAMAEEDAARERSDAEKRSAALRGEKETGVAAVLESERSSQ